ncbi:helix-turn-helix domain-containing protein [Nocardia transvalensis]|nr:helix-turn-helix domain-containing protein [Nocardia transvalensis]
MSELQMPTLAEFVRTRRTESTTSAPSGMSRQQLAAAIHSSIGYVAKIEQGDAHCPSPGVLDALAAVFGLDADERVYLYRLAGQKPQEHPGDSAPTSLQPMLDALAPHLAAVLGEGAELVACNHAFDTALPGVRASGSLLRWYFTDPYARLVVEEWEKEARVAVGRLRHYGAGAPESDTLRRLLDELGDQPDFRRLWTSQRVATHRHDPVMRLRNPETGEVYTVRVYEFDAAGRSRGQRMIVGLLVDTDSARPQ